LRETAEALTRRLKVAPGELSSEVETLKFRQMRSGESTATFIRGTNGTRAEWAMGWSEDPMQSALRAVIACANRLLSVA
jgi:hypothetical protein